MALKPRTEYGAWIRSLREAKGLKQQEAANQLGYSRSFMCQIEGSHFHKRGPSFRTVVELCNFYGVTLDEFAKAMMRETQQ